MATRQITRWGALTAAAVALGVGVDTSASPSEQLPALANPTGSDIVFEGVQFWSFKGSRLSSQGTAEHLTYDRNGGSTHGRNPFLRVLPRKLGDLESRFTSIEAKGQVAARVADASDHVTLTRDDGRALTESAHFEGAQHQISGTQPIDVITNRFKVHGTAFTLDTTSEQVEMEGPVNGDGKVRR